MTKRKKLPKSIRKHIRQEKARLRREILNLLEQKKQIEEIYKKMGIKREESASLPPPEAVGAKGIARKKIK